MARAQGRGSDTPRIRAGRTLLETRPNSTCLKGGIEYASVCAARAPAALGPATNEHAKDWTARFRGRHAAAVEESASKRLNIAYIVVAVLMAPMMFFSASTKLTLNPGAVHVINEVVGFPVSLFPLLAACEIAGGIGLLVGIYRPKLGVAAAIGLVLYFVGAIIGHIRVEDWAGLKAPITPFLLAVTTLTLRVLSMPRARP
jgi:hypothetical protein